MRWDGFPTLERDTDGSRPLLRLTADYAGSEEQPVPLALLIQDGAGGRPGACVDLDAGELRWLRDDAIPHALNRIARYELRKVTTAIRAHHFVYSDEHALQAGLAAALTGAGFRVEREVQLDGRSRIDLLVDRIGIEVKVASDAYTVQRQLRRYLASPRLDAIALVTNRVRHLQIGDVDGYPVEIVNLAGAGL